MKKRLKKITISSDADFKKYGVEREMIMNSTFTSKSSNSKRKFVEENHNEKGGSSDGRRIVKGFFSTTQKDRVKDVITVGALKGSKDDLLKEGANTVFFNHDTNAPIGRVLSTEVKKEGGKTGLYGEILISKAKDTDSIWTKIKERVLNAFSIRLNIKKMEIIKDNVTGKIDEFRILSMELFEVSVVGLPCNAGCSITSSSGKSFGQQSKIKKANKTRRANVRNKEKNQVAYLKESLKDFRDEILESVQDIVKNAGKSEEDIKREEAIAVLKEQGIDTSKLFAKSADEVELTEDQKKIKELEAKLKEKSEGEELTEDQKRIKALEEQLKELEEGTDGRKGATDEEDDDDAGEIKKSLKSADDPETLKYVFHLMDNESELEKLSDSEKAKAKSIYMSAYMVSNARD